MLNLAIALILCLGQLDNGVNAIMLQEGLLPKDFELVARYYPGFSSWRPWVVRITSDGKVTQGQYNMKTFMWIYKHNITLSAVELKRLNKLLLDVKFTDLSNRYGGDIRDSDTIQLSYKHNNAQQTVKVHAPDRVKNKEMARFLHVLVAVLRIAPSPNDDQTAKLYEKLITTSSRP